MTKDTGFDAFFQAVTGSPEFKWIVEKDWKWDFSKALKDMEANISKAGDIAKWFNDTFATQEAIDIWNSFTTSDIEAMSQYQRQWEEKQKIEVEYFTNKKPEIWWFKWVAWMDELKQSLKEWFIGPLKFKFLVEWIQKKDNVVAENEVWEKDKKEEIYKKLYEEYQKFKVNIPTWLLFYGPPWTGKTFITRKLAEELGAWMIKKSVWEFGSSYVHATSKNIKEFFSEAKKASEKWPIILFLDEIDSLVSKRTDFSDPSKTEEVSQFLQEFNALSESPNLIVVAATNRPDNLDSAILRSGRFDKKIYIGPPDQKARKELFQIYIEKEDRPHEKLDYDELATLTDWYVAADIETICEEVSRDASKSILDLADTLDDESIDLSKIEKKLWKNIITMELLIKAISDTVSSLKMVDMSVYEEWEKSLV